MRGKEGGLGKVWEGEEERDSESERVGESGRERFKEREGERKREREGVKDGGLGSKGGTGIRTL
jgi:hypothetical protein